MPDWHQHEWQGVALHAHVHPDATPGHSHDDYHLIVQMGEFPRLERDGRRLPGEIVPGEQFDGSDHV